MVSFVEEKTVGIDLGTTFSSLAEVGLDGHPVTIPNADGGLRTPSVVFLGEEGHVLVGPSFERHSNEDPSQIVAAIKRQMGNKNFYLVYMNKRPDSGVHLRVDPQKTETGLRKTHRPHRQCRDHGAL